MSTHFKITTLMNLCIIIRQSCFVKCTRVVLRADWPSSGENHLAEGQHQAGFRVVDADVLLDKVVDYKACNSDLCASATIGL